jgi:lysophospholipase L1-like esterase
VSDAAVSDAAVSDAAMSDATASDAAPSDAAANASTDSSVSDTSAPNGPTDSGASGVDAEGPLALVHFIGRFDMSDPAGPMFAWPGTEIAASFTGTGLDVMLSDAGANFFSVVIDGGPPSVLSTSSTTTMYTLASNLAATGTHTVTLTKKTESYFGVVQYLGFSPQGGALVESPEPFFSRIIEYVGDSISCGYGVLGVGPSCAETSAVEDETVAYDALTAAQLSAQQIVIAYSGIGMYRSNDGSTADQMPVLYTRTLADDPSSVWAFPPPAPNVVVINLGTSDFTPPPDGGSDDPGTDFQTTYTAFVQQVRTLYPSAGIICALSPLLVDPDRSTARTYIQNVVAQLNGGGDQRVVFLEFAQQLSSDGYGCDYHPSQTTHQKMAAVLVPEVRTLAGW